MPDLIEMIVFNVFTNRRGPNTEADRKTAYNNVQVGERGPNIENFKKKFYRQCKLAGPQHRS
ncbi:TPA: nitrogen fixation protein NifR [Staphylococcus aureus]|nr:nitrogen fixation protein NifR [Staphylococcus aureus]HAR7234174.1 nitrogen fixation protein NifR [Staphylococcus aureus]